MVFVLLVAVTAFFAATQERFLTTSNVEALLTSAAILWVVAIGLTLVMLTGDFDLSLGSLLALSGIVFGILHLDLGVPALVAIGLTVAVTTLLGGAVNGCLVGRLKVSFLIVMLGTLTLYRGLVNLLSDTTIRGVDSPLLEDMTFARLAGLPVPAWTMIITFAVAAWVLSRTYFGRDVYAVGGTPTPRTVGHRRRGHGRLMYAIAGGLASLGGVLQVTRIGAVSPGVGDAIIFDATAVVLLGTSSSSTRRRPIGRTGPTLGRVAELGPPTRDGAALREGTPGTALHEAFRPSGREHLITKRRYSAFFGTIWTCCCEARGSTRSSSREWRPACAASRRHATRSTATTESSS